MQLYYSWYWHVFVCRMSHCVWSETENAYTLFSLNSAAVYAIRDAPAKQAGLEFNAGKCDVGFALIWSHHRIVLEARLA